jgi:Ca-activated chloride channel homolog
VYARGLRFEFESEPGVQLRYAFRLMPETGPLQLSSPIQLGNLQHQKSIGVLLEFLLPPLPRPIDEFRLARGPIWMELPGRASNVRLNLDIRCPVKQNVEYHMPSPIIVEAMSKLTLYRMHERARSEVDAGLFELAGQRLRAIATHLLSKGDRELAQSVLLEADNIQRNHQFSKDGDKRIKYGTRALLLTSGLEQNP